MRSHSEEKPHKCKTCEKCFKDKGNLKQHEATHKSDRPHKCEFCGQCFTLQRNMLRHAEIHAQSKASVPLPNHNTVLAQAACVRHVCLRAPCVAWPLLSHTFALSLSLFFSPSFAFDPFRGISHVRNNFPPNILA